MKRGIVTLLVTFGIASSAHAAPGDPRLVQGVLEWPAKLTVEPFVVIRADDGRWYYAEIKGVKRLESGPLTSGTRVAVLGTEAARPHEITAIALGAGDAAALALALMPHVNGPVAPAPTAVQSPNAPKPAAAEPSSKTEPSPAPTASTPKAELTSTPKAELTPTPKTASKPERLAVTPSAAPPPAAALSVAATPVSTVAPTPATVTPTVASVPAAPSTLVVPPPAKAATPAVSESPAPSAPRVAEAPTPGPPIGEKASAEKALEPTGDGPRWTELRGTVKVIAGNWIVVRADSGQLVLVDLSTVRGGSASLKPGAAIALYGTPTEQKFQAMGIVQPENRPAAKPTTVPPRR